MSQATQIYVRGYPKKVGEQDLKKFYSRFGSVETVKLLKDYAFVTFSSPEEAKEAVSKTNGSTEFETELVAEIAKEPGIKVKCWNCDGEGHRSNMCPNPKVQGGRTSKESRRRRSSSSSESESSRKDKRKKKKSKKSRKISKRKRSSSSSSSSSSSRDRKRSSKKR